MRNSTKEMFEKVKIYLLEHNYATASQIAEHCNLSDASVYRIIRMMRLDNIGVLVTPHGYILSEFAKKNDDVHFLRRLNGRRASDIIALTAAERHIRERWNAVSDRRALNLITAPLRTDLAAVNNGLKILRRLGNKKGLKKV